MCNKVVEFVGLLSFFLAVRLHRDNRFTPQSSSSGKALVQANFWQTSAQYYLMKQTLIITGKFLLQPVSTLCRRFFRNGPANSA